VSLVNLNLLRLLLPNLTDLLPLKLLHHCFSFRLQSLDYRLCIIEDPVDRFIAHKALLLEPKVLDGTFLAEEVIALGHHRLIEFSLTDLTQFRHLIFAECILHLLI
jgi:hypothetical protein